MSDGFGADRYGTDVLAKGWREAGVTAIVPIGQVKHGNTSWDTTHANVYLPPHAYLTHQLNDRAWFGVGLFSRYGVGTQYDSDWGGAGNIYRAEVLFRHRINPFKEGRTVSRRTWNAVWPDLVDLLRLGVRDGRIDTVRDEHLPGAMGREPRVDRHGGEVYVYRRAGLPCLVCGTPVRTQVLEGRNLYWCPRCQRRR